MTTTTSIAPARAREEIVRQIKSVEKNPTDVDTPISVALELQSLRQSENPLEKSNAETLTMLTEIRTTITEIREDPPRRRIHPGMVEELAMFLGEIYSVLETAEIKDGPLKAEQLDFLRSRLHRSERLLHHVCLEAGLPPDMFMRRMRNRRELKEK